MATTSPTWKGTRDLQLQPDYPQWDTDKESRTVTLLYHGPYETCLASQPVPGTTIAGYPTNIFVTKVRVSHQDGGAGQLHITAATKSFDPSNPDNNDAPENVPIYGIDWLEVQRKLTAHPRYAVGGTKALTTRDLADIDNWIDEKDAALREVYKYTNTDKDGATTEVTLSANAQDYAAKYQRGQDSYTIFVPEISRTTYYSQQPTTGDAGDIQSPPINVGGSWVYRKSADSARSTKDGWERTEKWTGADSWDTDLYD